MNTQQAASKSWQETPGSKPSKAHQQPEIPSGQKHETNSYTGHTSNQKQTSQGKRGQKAKQARHYSMTRPAKKTSQAISAKKHQKVAQATRLPCSPLRIDWNANDQQRKEFENLSVISTKDNYLQNPCKVCV